MMLFSTVKIKPRFIRLLLPFLLCYSPIHKAFEALDIYDYFKAKKCFLKVSRKFPVAGNYGLSTIYHRNDNPFYHPDSAYVRIENAVVSLSSVSKREQKILDRYRIDSVAVSRLYRSIVQHAWDYYAAKSTVASWDHFIRFYSSAGKTEDAVRARDSLAFELVQNSPDPADFEEFMQKYPGSVYESEARARFERTLFLSATKSETIEAYEKFINTYPSSPHHREASRKLYFLITDGSTDYRTFHDFIKRYPANPYVNEAWQRVYELFMAANYSDNVYRDFNAAFPDFPFKQQLKVDYELSKEDFLPFRKNGKWGFINNRGEVRIEPRYEFTEAFADGLALVSKNGKLGFVNKLGDEVIIPFYDDAENFREGLAVVSEQGKSGVVNRNGQMIVPLKYDEIGDFNEGLASAFYGEKCGYINSVGEEVLPFRFSLCNDFISGTAICELNETMGIIDVSGNEIIPFAFESVVPIGHNLVKVKLSETGKTGIYSRNGTVIIAPVLDDAGDITENRICIIKNDRVGYADSTGKLVVPYQFEYFNGVLSAGEFHGGYAAVKINDLFGLIDSSGKRIIAPRYGSSGKVSHNLIRVKKRKKWGYLGVPSGETRIAFIYDDASDFVYERAVIRENDKWGVISTSGKVIVPPAFDAITPLGNSLYLVTLNDSVGVMMEDDIFLADAVYHNHMVYMNNYLRLWSDESECWINIAERSVIFKD